MTQTQPGPSHAGLTAVTTIGVALGIVVAILTNDVILGVIAGASFIAISVGFQRLW